MKTKAVRIYGKSDLRLEEFELPEITDDEVLVKIITDSVCMSSYKAQLLGPDHARVPDDVDKNPTIIGHEMCGEIVKVGKNYQDKYTAGEKFALQPALPHGEMNTVGYAWQYCGGAATYAIIPSIYMENDCLLKYSRDDFYSGSLAEPYSCVIGGFHVNYHSEFTNHTHIMGIKKGGNCALLAGVGPMGLGAIDYALNAPIRPKLLAVTDINQERLDRAEKLFSKEYALARGVELHYINTANGNAVSSLKELTGGVGYDDVFVYAPVKAVIEQADDILGFDGCINFFAGPTNKELKAEINFYDVHYNFSHVAGNAGGTTADMIESLGMMSEGSLNPAVMVTHVGGLDSA
ncbi:MAG: zinc-binding dehydrogenase, partial [Clostridia bacterium]|nr:zinc-binding dehydrogenase [Clostridia bacterium]